MIQINQQQASDRFDSLPDNIKDVGFSPVTVQIIQQVSDNNHLNRDRMFVISKLVGYVLFGFIHPEDLAKEIREELNIAPEIANSIAGEIDRKIFASVRGDLEKNYAPPAPEVARVPAESAVPPESVIDLKGSRVVAEAADDKQKIAEAVPAEIPITPEIKAEPQKVVAKEIKIAEEPAPVIIHKETEFRPTTGEAVKRSLGGIFGLLTPKEKPSEVKPAVARIEMTGPEKPKEDVLKPAPAVKPEPPKIRVVHYTELRTPFSPLDATRDKPVEAPVKPPVSAPTPARLATQNVAGGPPIIAPAQLQKEEIRKEVFPPVPAKMPEPSKISEFQKATGSLRPPETPKPFEPIRKPEPIRPFEPVKPVESVKPSEPPQVMGPIKPAESPKPTEPPKPFNIAQGKPLEPPKPPQPPKTEEKKSEKPFGVTQDKPGDEGDIIDLRTFEKIK